jgi:hypothetical protein
VRLSTTFVEKKRWQAAVSEHMFQGDAARDRAVASQALHLDIRGNPFVESLLTFDMNFMGLLEDVLVKLLPVEISSLWRPHFDADEGNETWISPCLVGMDFQKAALNLLKQVVLPTPVRPITALNCCPAGFKVRAWISSNTACSRG